MRFSTPTPVALRHLKAALFALALLPFTLLVVRAFAGALGSNPVEAITHETGIWALRLLFITLAVTPLRRLTGAAWIVRYRRMLGLFAFFYAALHLLTYAVLDASLDPSYVLEDLSERRYILVGFAAFLLLVPLAATSTNGMIRRLGPLRWRRLHRLVYLAAPLAALHFFWLAKAALLEPLIYASLLALLLFLRLPPVVWVVALFAPRSRV